MDGYLVNFIVYTLSMLGVLFLAIMVAKKSMFSPNSNKNKHSFLGVETQMSLEPRKNLYVIRAGEERFLISTDGETTRFMTKLDCDSAQISRLSEEKLDKKAPVNAGLTSMQKIISGVDNIGRK